MSVNPSYSGGRYRMIMARDLVKSYQDLISKISQAEWFTPAIPVTKEAEV
jgi:hypothetical protein